jgi:adhesin HecA-like repeat protein
LMNNATVNIGNVSGQGSTNVRVGEVIQTQGGVGQNSNVRIGNQ